MDKKVLNVPNMVTVFRFPASIAMLWLLMCFSANPPEGGYPVWISICAAIVSFLTFLSDFFDGKIARAYGTVTNFGKMMDPIADSIFFTLLLLGLAVSPRFEVSIWFTVIMLYREAGVQAMRRYAAYRGVVLMAGWSGKFKMVAQCVAMAGLGVAILVTDTGLYPFSESTLRGFAWWASCLTALIGLWSLGVYLWQLPAMLREQARAAAEPGQE